MNKRIQLIALVTLPFSVMAQTAITWDGTGSTDFATEGNWVGDTAPSNDLTSSLATFSGAATANQPNLAIDAGGTIMFSTTETLTVAGTVTLDNSFGIDDLIGISSGTANGTYTLINGDVSDSFTSGFENIGLGNAFDLGGSKSAYFEEGSLSGYRHSGAGHVGADCCIWWRPAVFASPFHDLV
jgi:hypothetical protein